MKVADRSCMSPLRSFILRRRNIQLRSERIGFLSSTHQSWCLSMLLQSWDLQPERNSLKRSLSRLKLKREMLVIYIYGRFILYWTMNGICCRYSSTRYTNQDVDRLLLFTAFFFGTREASDSFVMKRRVNNWLSLSSTSSWKLDGARPLEYFAANSNSDNQLKTTDIRFH